MTETKKAIPTAPATILNVLTILKVVSSCFSHIGRLVFDSAGSPFTANYINSVGDLMVNIQSDLGAELRARKVYEELHRHVEDPGAREMFDFLIQREEAHATLFKEAVERIQDTQGGFDPAFRDKQYAKLYPELSAGGPGPDVFKSLNAGIITGPFSGNPDTDTFGGLNPPVQ
ncbi:manganese catalase family protein [Pullulanibacillus sp. KACC 23026]|uniref:manganese catalase family protein n=1 Tax=Pullulanibacillus sp. KACC 23026 TaxID=3028315 RepID=UPI0023B1D247|nr:manganese catalase family protein [Pullulanibacillus sp. KACC 23026]WEG14591.1 manganese catalase family protein [Pullulanibacillus sp. KACC 23026]